MAGKSEARKQELEERQAAANRLGLFRNDDNVSQLKPTTQHAPKMGKRWRGSIKGETEEQYINRQIADWELKHLPKADAVPPYDVADATRYPGVQLSRQVSKRMLATVLRRYEHVMKPQGVTPGDLRTWREHIMLMSREDLASLVRVSARTICGWENGASPIPFSMWWVIHSTVQDPEHFLTRPGFHDFYIDYRDGEAQFCSWTWPDIRYSATDLYVNRCALNEVFSLREELRRVKDQVAELTAENTKLRQMLKTDGVTAELKAMQEHIAGLLTRIQTADVHSFEEAAQSIAALPVARKTA